MMDCLRARKIIFSKDAFVISAHIAMAKQHVGSCPDCQQIIRQHSNFKHILKAKLPGQTAPTTLRENILSSIAADRLNKVRAKPIKRKSIFAGGVAVVFLAILLSSYSGLFERRLEVVNSAVNTLAQDHIASKIRENPLDVRTADAAELERWFALRVDFSVRIPTLSDSNLLGGRLCLINGERVISLAFEKESYPISMYIMGRDVIDLARMRVIDSGDRKRVFHGDAKGCNVIMWEEKGLVFGLVSDMNENDLVELLVKS